MSKRVDKRSQKRKQKLRRTIRQAHRAKGDGLLPTIIRAFSVGIGRVVIDLPIPNRLAGVAYSVGLAAAGHTALRIASAAPHWSGDPDVLKSLDSMTDEFCDELLTTAFEEIPAEDYRIAREFLARPSAFLPLRAEDLSWCEWPETDAQALGPENTIEAFDRGELKGTEVAIIHEVMPLLVQGLAEPSEERPQQYALLDFICAANALGKIALSRWPRADARFLNYLACLTSRQDCPEAEMLRGVK